MSQLNKTRWIQQVYLVVTKQYRLQGTYLIEDLREGCEPVVSKIECSSHSLLLQPPNISKAFAEKRLEETGKNTSDSQTTVHNVKGVKGGLKLYFTFILFTLFITLFIIINSNLFYIQINLKNCITCCNLG